MKRAIFILLGILSFSGSAFSDPAPESSDLKMATVSIIGSVAKQQKLTFEPESFLTVRQAIIERCGGLGQYANPRKVKVVRQVDGKATTIMLDLKAVIDAKPNAKDVFLEDGDVVVVPERGIGCF